MTVQIVEVSFDDDGNATIETAGFKGRECLIVTQPLKDALGVSVKMCPKPEMTQHLWPRALGAKKGMGR